MAIDPKKRQKKLMKKRRKDKTRKSRQAQQSSYAALTPQQKIRRARNYPIHECLICPSWRDTGLATILISRRQPDGRLTFGNYLVDINCLGLKSSFSNADMPVRQYERELRNRFCRGEEPLECSVSLAHHIIYGAIEFAAQFGFEPDSDFALAQYVLEDIDDLEPCEETVEFGRDGKPVYIEGPYDDSEKILRQLGKSTNEDDFGNMDHAGGPTPETTIRRLVTEEIDLRGEVDRIIESAQDSQGRIVVVGPLVFFSTESGDAWALDSEDEFALQLARGGDVLPFHITETAGNLAIEWTADYQIDGEDFIVAERSGRIRTIRGYPVSVIQEACREAGLAEEPD